MAAARVLPVVSLAALPAASPAMAFRELPAPSRVALPAVLRVECQPMAPESPGMSPGVLRAVVQACRWMAAAESDSTGALRVALAPAYPWTAAELDSTEASRVE